uniref:Uncharacterized protein n=1 Tax=Arundo donax TaxID=35708 RepID=A0A0A9BIK0_ARUDO
MNVLLSDFGEGFLLATNFNAISSVTNLPSKNHTFSLGTLPLVFFSFLLLALAFGKVKLLVHKAVMFLFFWRQL